MKHLLFILCTCLSVQVSAGNIKIAITASPLCSVLYVAEAKNLFTKYGIELDIHLVTSGDHAMRALLNRDVDLATSSDITIMKAAQDMHAFKVVASLATSQKDTSITVNTDQQIRTPKDLVGKSLGYTPGTPSQYYLDTFLLLAGIEPSQVNLLAVPPDKMKEGILNKQLDAISTQEPWATKTKQALGEKGKQFRDLSAYTLLFNLVGRTDWLNQNRKTASLLLQALIDTEHFIQHSPAEAQAIVAKKLDLQLDHLQPIWHFYQFHITLNQVLVTALELESTWAKANNTSSNPINFLDYIDPEPLKTVDANRVSIVF